VLRVPDRQRGQLILSRLLRAHSRRIVSDGLTTKRQARAVINERSTTSTPLVVIDREALEYDEFTWWA
jgi:hypothetical protein